MFKLSLSMKDPITLLSITAFLNSLVFFAPVALLVRTQYGITVAEFFLLQAILSIGIFLFEVPCGWVTDKIGYKYSLIISQILLCVTRVIFLVGGDFYLFLIEAVVEAISASLLSGTYEAYVYEHTGSEHFEEKLLITENYGTLGFIASTLLFFPLLLGLGLLSVGVCFLWLAVSTNYWAFLPMIILPFLLGIPSVRLAKISNAFVDSVAVEDKRATFLSVLNQGANFCEIIFLLFAAAISVEKVSTIFILLALLFGGSALLFVRKNKRKTK